MHTDSTKYNKTIEEWRVQDMLSYLYTHLETDTTEQLQKIISNYQDFVADIVQKPNIEDKKLKEYQFDSLVYRYIRAREQQAFYEYLNRKFIDRSREFYEKDAQRDILRFVEILKEAMGDHS